MIDIEKERDLDKLQKTLEPYIMELSKKQRYSIRARYYGNKTFTEIGKSLGVGRTQARQITYMALSRLRKKLNRLLREDYDITRHVGIHMADQLKIDLKYQNSRLINTFPENKTQEQEETSKYAQNTTLSAQEAEEIAKDRLIRLYDAKKHNLPPHPMIIPIGSYVIGEYHFMLIGSNSHFYIESQPINP
jgi:hypothetical protein